MGDSMATIEEIQKAVELGDMDQVNSLLDTYLLNADPEEQSDYRNGWVISGLWKRRSGF